MTAATQAGPETRTRAPVARHGLYSLTYNSAQITSMLRRFNTLVNTAVTAVYGDDFGHRFSAYTAGWEMKLHFALEEIGRARDRGETVPLSTLLRPTGRLWREIVDSAGSYGFALVDRTGFYDHQTGKSFKFNVPGMLSMLRAETEGAVLV